MIHVKRESGKVGISSEFRRHARQAKRVSQMAGLIAGISIIALAPAQAKPRAANEPAAAAPAGRQGTVVAPNYSELMDFKEGEFGFHLKNFTYMSSKGPVAGIVASISFVVDAPAKDVWPVLKDFNNWEGPFGIRYTGANGELVSWGDLYTDEDQGLGEQTFRYGASVNNYSFQSVPSRVIKVIPEHLLMMWEVPPTDGSTEGLSPGDSTVLINDYQGKSYVNVIFHHSERFKVKTEKEALEKSAFGINYKAEYRMKTFRDQFIPKLRELVKASRSGK